MNSNIVTHKKATKAKFTPEEDAKLRKLVSLTHPNDWNQIALQFNNRNSRQVKERWEYYLSPNVNNGPWSPEEDELLISKYNELGTKWKVIAKFFIGRTNTACKNRFLAMQREKLRHNCNSPPVVTKPKPIAPVAMAPSDYFMPPIVDPSEFGLDFDMDPFSSFQEEPL